MILLSRVFALDFLMCSVITQHRLKSEGVLPRVIIASRGCHASTKSTHHQVRAPFHLPVRSFQAPQRVCRRIVGTLACWNLSDRVGATATRGDADRHIIIVKDDALGI